MYDTSVVHGVQFTSDDIRLHCKFCTELRCPFNSGDYTLILQNTEVQLREFVLPFDISIWTNYICIAISVLRLALNCLPLHRSQHGERIVIWRNCKQMASTSLYSELARFVFTACTERVCCTHNSVNLGQKGAFRKHLNLELKRLLQKHWL